MATTIERKDDILCNVTCSIPASVVDIAVFNKTQNIAKTIKLDGFRQGKVPSSKVKKMYGDSIRAEIIEDILPKKYMEVFQEEKLNVAGIVNIKLLDNVAGVDLKFSVEIELVPEFNVIGYDKITIEKPDVTITKADEEKMLNNLLNQLATYDDVSRAAENTDKIEVDYIGKIDGKVFEGSEAKQQLINLGSGQMLPEFENGIVGMKANETKSVEVNFPDDYTVDDLKSKTAIFEITLKKVSQRNTPEINEELMTKLGVKGGTENFSNTIKENMERELKKAISHSLKSQVFQKIQEVNEIAVPTSMIREEIYSTKQNFMKQYAQNQKINMNDIPDEAFKPEAESRVKLGLIVSSLIKENSIKASEDTIKEIIDDLSAVYTETDDVMEHLNKNKKEMDNIKALALETAVVDFIIKKITVINKEQPFFEVIRQSTGQ